jgi:hypothetical protein
MLLIKQNGSLRPKRSRAGGRKRQRSVEQRTPQKKLAHRLRVRLSFWRRTARARSQFFEQLPSGRVESIISERNEKVRK